MNDTPLVDITGIGLGPFNLGLAALLEDQTTLSATFLERKVEFRWHEGLLLSGTTLQVPFLADLVTMADPTHRLSYLNYLHQHDRLYGFYYYDHFQVPRQEYDHYCRWASQQLHTCRFGEHVSDVHYETDGEHFRIETQSLSGFKRHYRSRHLAVGVGTAPILPQWARVSGPAPMMHSAEFGKRRAELAHCKEVTVVGSGQSAAECVLALFSELTPEQVAAGASIRWITRSPGFHPMEYSKLGQECFTPAYMRYFHSLPRERRRDIVADQGLLYKGISFSTIAAIYDLIYERSIGGIEPGLTLLSNCEIERVEQVDGRLRLAYRHRELEQTGTLHADALVAATGYGHAWPAWFERLKDELLVTDAHGDCIVDEDFTARRRDEGAGRIFVQNAEIFQHGVGSPDLGIAAIRNATIVNKLLGRAHYRLPRRSSFQHYGMHDA
ncbi:putative histamine N-monooxygenase [Pseudomonas alabamensis]|uniref:putative histamine N-monooxygenase n=1 Tax=Pseudomonas alabamensis TaxID=3064349 RepID=UPI003F650724